MPCGVDFRRLAAFKSADLKVPPRPNPSPWTLFIKGHMNNAGKPIQEAQSAVKKLAVEWKSMTPAQQRVCRCLVIYYRK